MSKRKDKRKKKGTQHKTKQNADHGSFLGGMVEAKADAKNGDKRDGHFQQQYDHAMTFRERLEASSFTDWLLAAFTAVLAAFAILQFVIIDGQLDVMRKDQRGWLNVRAEFNPEHSPTVTGTLKVTNSGKTPILHVEVNALIEVVPNGQEPHFNGVGDVSHLMITTGALSPNIPTDWPITRRQAGQDYPLTDEEIAALKEGRAWIALHGRATYQDVFEVQHWTQFCFWRSYADTKYASLSCPEYNNIDEQ